MIATATVDGQPFAGKREFWLERSAGNAKASRSNGHSAGGIGVVLKQTRLTMLELSAQTRIRFGEESPYFIPRTFLYKQKTGITPHICQLVALSEVTGYRFIDWMSVCGFDLNLILQLQLILPNERTILISLGNSFVPNSLAAEETSSTALPHEQRYYYAKIGSSDAVAYPDVRPGSIVRADRCYSNEIFKDTVSSKRLWLVQHPGGLTCCRIKRIGKEEVVLFPHLPPLSAWPLRLSVQARILGLVDGQSCSPPELNYEPMRRVADSAPSFLPSSEKGKMTFSGVLRRSRLRTGLTFRQAHKMTLQIARLLQNRDFGISISLLSDYEAMNKLPRHIAKIITLCVIYGIDLRELLQAAEIELHDSGKRPLFAPQELTRKNHGRVTAQATALGVVSGRPQVETIRSVTHGIGAYA